MPFKPIQFCLLIYICLSTPTLGYSHDEVGLRVRQAFQPIIDWDVSGALAVGVIQDGTEQIFCFGRQSQENDEKPDADSIFEIGSITKVFSAILLADMVLNGEVQLDDPVQDYLPQDVRIPEWEDTPITLHHLARHTSGLPRLPEPFQPQDWNDPYRDYTAENLYRYIPQAKIQREPGSEYEYSNLGMGLLGFLLSQMSNMSYEELIVSRVCEPLGLNDTRMTLTPLMSYRAIPGLDNQGGVVHNWEFQDTFAASGALRSSLSDMLRFLSVNMGLKESSLSPAIRFAQKAHVYEEKPRVLLAWHVAYLGPEDAPLIWHNGGTGGYASFIGFMPHEKLGIVALWNHNLTQLTTASMNYLRMSILQEPDELEMPERSYSRSVLGK